jgi:hypothetical protein
MMRDRVNYLFAIAALITAIFALVLVLGQNQPSVSAPQTQQTNSGQNLQTLFTTLGQRVNNDASFSFRLRVTALSEGSTITVSQNDARITEVGTDYFCLSSDQPGRVCYPFSQLLAVAVPS